MMREIGPSAYQMRSHAMNAPASSEKTERPQAMPVSMATPIRKFRGIARFAPKANTLLAWCIPSGMLLKHLMMHAAGQAVFGNKPSVGSEVVSIPKDTFACPHERTDLDVEFIRSGINISKVAPYTRQPLLAHMLWRRVVQEFRENV